MILRYRRYKVILAIMCDSPFSLGDATPLGISNGFATLVEVFTLPLVFRTDPRGMAQIPRNSAESADPRTPMFWCIWLHHSARNDAESGSFSRGSVEFTRTVPCSLIFAQTRTVFRPCSPCVDRLGLQNILVTCRKIAPPRRIEPMDYSTIT